MCQNHFHILVLKFTQLSLEFVRRVHYNRLLIQIVPWIHNPRAEKSIPPDPSSLFFIKLVSVSSGSALKNCKLETLCLLFGPLAQHLGSDKRRVFSPCVTLPKIFIQVKSSLGKQHYKKL